MAQLAPSKGIFSNSAAQTSKLLKDNKFENQPSNFFPSLHRR